MQTTPLARRKFVVVLAVVTLISGCNSGDLGTERQVSAVQRVDSLCSPYSFSNERIKDLGLDICTDGRVFDWDGNYRGRVVSRNKIRLTVRWLNVEPTESEFETFTVQRRSCRASGLRKDCA